MVRNHIFPSSDMSTFTPQVHFSIHFPLLKYVYPLIFFFPFTLSQWWAELQYSVTKLSN
jgi:hypothetical protein